MENIQISEWTLLLQVFEPFPAPKWNTLFFGRIINRFIFYVSTLRTPSFSRILPALLFRPQCWESFFDGLKNDKMKKNSTKCQKRNQITQKEKNKYEKGEKKTKTVENFYDGQLHARTFLLTVYRWTAAYQKRIPITFMPVALKFVCNIGWMCRWRRSSGSTAWSSSCMP